MQLYFDECCSRRLSREIKEFFASDYPDLETCHVLDEYGRGTKDSEWLKPLQENDKWIVITHDHGRDPKKEKLPVVCRALGVTYVLISSSIISAGYTEQKTALVSVWQELLELYRLPNGTQVKLCIGNVKGGKKRFELRVNKKLLSSVLNQPHQSE